MNKESKTDLLLRMMEQPEQYTERQWHDILSDDECRELYTMMALTQSSIDAAQADAALTEKEIEEALGKVKNERVKNERVKNEKFKLLFTYRKVAAIFLAVVFFGGLSIAAYRVFSPRTDSLQSAQVTAPSLTGRAGGESFVRFSDIRLDSILTVVSAHYGKAVCFLDTAAQELRLSTMWASEDSLAVFISTLNEFDGLLLKEERDTLFVESETEEAE